MPPLFFPVFPGISPAYSLPLLSILYKLYNSKKRKFLINGYFFGNFRLTFEEGAARMKNNIDPLSNRERS